MLDLTTIEGFDWDKGNSKKSWEKHNVTPKEAEEVFINTPLLFYEDKKHSHREQRLFCLGQTNRGRYLYTSFTLRKQSIRIISSRDMNKRERNIYENEKT